MSNLLELKTISVSSNKKALLKDFSVKLQKGELSLLMGPNGAGKSTFANIVMGNPKYELSEGKLFFEGEDISELSADKRAQKGIFVSFQHPVEVEGLAITNFLRASYNAVKEKNLNLAQFHKLLKEKMEELELDASFRSRFLNVGFSGGEKKRSELLQLLLLEPKLAILDEIDSGLDVDALKMLTSLLLELKKKGMSILLISHNPKVLEYLEADRVFLLKDGRLVKEGKQDLAEEIAKKGFK
jgi:Fe-S cluster assembly ATP-binding protein